MGKKWSMERVRRITISSSRLAYASGSTDSAVAVSITWAGASDPSTGMCALRLQETCSADSSLTGERSFAVV